LAIRVTVSVTINVTLNATLNATKGAVNRWMLGVVFFALASHIQAASGPVWKVTSTHAQHNITSPSTNTSSAKQQHVFIGGTIHVLSASDYPLPAVFDQAYQQADIMVFEADMGQMQTAEAQRLIIDKTSYKDGSTLQQALSANSYQSLGQFLALRGDRVQNYDQFKPGMVTVLLTLNELARLGQSGQGVDEFYDNLAVKDGKKRLFFETIEQQLEFLGNMGQGQEDSLVLHTLKELEDLSSAMVALKSAWRKGNNPKLIEVALTPWQADFPALYDALLVKRNQAWIPQIEAMLVTPEVEYILVGALHLAGNDGLLQQLRDRGYQVEQLH
jgi:uncharacterized protein